MSVSSDERLATGRVTVDLGAVCRNWQHMASLAPDAEAAAVCKADAYGLGLDEIGAALYEQGCRIFFVATPQEGVGLRRIAAEAEIFVLAGLTRDNAPFYREAGLTPVCNDLADVECWSEWCRISGMRRPCAFHVDTGMNRLGMEAGEALDFARRNATEHLVSLSLVMSHLACADEPGHAMNRRQQEIFSNIATAFPGIRTSLANSAGILLGRDFHFDVTRPGISLYGGESADSASVLQPVVTFEARILQIRTAKKGETVGYGATHCLHRDSRIAIAGFGYGDGLMRSASGSGVPMREWTHGASGWMAGHDVPVLGRVSMDSTAFDVTDIPEPTLAKTRWIEIFGPHRPIDEFARAAGTIGYECLTALQYRTHRRYRRD